jgi:multidrug efflux pump subunit AcrA (membrane-fusion protein)
VRLFRKSFLAHVREQDELEFVVPRRYTPLFWPMMATLSICATAFFAWCFLARLPLIIEAKGIVLPLGGVREVVPVGQGFVAQRKVAGGDTVKAGELLLALDNPERRAAYESARRVYVAMRAANDQQRAAADGKRDRALATLDRKLAAAKESYDRLFTIHDNLALAVGDYVIKQTESLKIEIDSLQRLAHSYEELRIGLETLRAKNLVGRSELISGIDRQSQTIRSLAGTTVEASKAGVEEQRMRYEQNNIGDGIARLRTEIADISGQFVQVADDYGLEITQLRLRDLSEREKLLDAERLLWWNTFVLSPYDGMMVAVNKSIGQVVAANSPIGMISIASQHRRSMLMLSDRVRSGAIRLGLGGASVEISLRDGDPVSSIKSALLDALSRLAPASRFTVTGDDRRFVIAGDSDDDAGQLERLSLQHFDLIDAEGLPVFAMILTIGDEWTSGKWVNLAIVRTQDAKRIPIGANALVKPDYEVPMIGAKLRARVRSVGEYASTSIESEAMIGSQELGKMMSESGSGGTVVVLDFERETNGQFQWSGDAPKIPIAIGATTVSRITVETMPAINLIFSFFARIHP